MSRTLAFGAAVWFAALGTELPALHACPVHDAGARGAHAHEHAAGDTPASPAAHQHEGNQQRDPSSHHGAQCNCPGQGCCSVAATLPASIVAGVETSTITLACRVPIARHALRGSAPHFLLPPAIGPPSLQTSSLT